MLKRLVFTQLVLGLLLSSLAMAATPAPRTFAPVQNGFVDQAATELPWIADRLLVKFTAEANQKANFNGNINSGDLAVALKDLPALASALGQAGAISIHAPNHRPANKAAGESVGAHLWYRVDLAAGTDVVAAATSLAKNPHLEYALPDLIAFPDVTPNDPLYANNWGHRNTAQLPDLDWGGTYGHTLPNTVGTVGFDADTDLAWDDSQGYGDPSVIIAILDSGVDIGHPDLNLVTGYDFGDNDNNPTDDSLQPGHGTACAGVAAATANNNLGAVGVAGGCSVMPLKVADSSGALGFSYIIDAVYYAADNGADVISMSFGAATTAYAPMDAAIIYAQNQGVILIASTGNENNSTIGYPAYNPNVLGVGAASPCGERKRSSSLIGEVNPGVNTDPNGYTCDGERWWGSNYGPAVQDHQGAVDIIAPTILPTTDILGGGGYDPGDYSGFFNGTSCSVPYISGVCALIKSANPGFTPAEVRTRLLSTAEDVISVESIAGWDRYTGYGMVDAAAAVANPVPDEVHAEITSFGGLGGAVSIYAKPDGTGTPLTAVRQWNGLPGDPPIIVDATIIVTLTDALGDPVVGFPAADITVAPSAGGWVLCSPLSADADTDINGQTTISGALFGGGFSNPGELMLVNVSSPLLTSTTYPGGLSGLEYFVNSGDLNGDLQADLTDVTVFAGEYFSGDNNYQADFHWNGTVNLSDITILASTIGAECLPKTGVTKAADQLASAGTLGLVFDAQSNASTRTASYGEIVDAYLVLNGEAAEMGIGAFAAELRTSENVIVHERNMIGQTLDLSQNNNLIGGFATPRSAKSNRPLTLMHLRVSVTDQSPAYFWLEAGSAVAMGGKQVGVRPASGSTTAPVAALNDKDFALNGEIPVAAELKLSIAPNPFNPKTEISFNLPATGQVDLRIFDARGKLVKTLATEVMTAGVHTLVWNGNDHSGRRAASGVYFSNLRTETGSVMQKMLLMK